MIMLLIEIQKKQEQIFGSISRINSRLSHLSQTRWRGGKRKNRVSSQSLFQLQPTL
jgi:hypothetical protein